MSITNIGCCFANIYDICQDEPGPTGPTGSTGNIGPSGPTGPTGPEGPPGAGVIPSSRFNTPITPQTITPGDGNPVYLDFDASGIPQNLYDYSNPNGTYTIVSGGFFGGEAILIGAAGYYNVGINLLGQSNDVVGQAAFQVTTGTGPVGYNPPNPTNPAICTVLLNLNVSVVPSTVSYTAAGSASANCLLNVGDLIRVAAVTNTTVTIDESSCLSIIYLGPQGSVGPVTPLVPGLPDQVLVTNPSGLSVEWSSDINLPGNFSCTGSLYCDGPSTFNGNGLFQNDLAVNNDLNVITGDLTVGTGELLVLVGDTTLQSLDIGSQLSFNSSSGVTGNIVYHTGSVPQWQSPSSLSLPLSSIIGGSPNQLVQSNGTNLIFVTDVLLPGNIVAQSGSIALFQETRVYNSLKLGGNLSGTTGMVCVSDGSSVPHWEYPQYFCLYYQNSPTQDMNASSSVLLMDNAVSDVASSYISYSAGIWTVSEAGNYICTFQTNPTTVGVGAQTLINFRINGSFAGSVFTTITPNVQSITLQKTYRLNAGSTVEIVSQPIVAGVINTSSSDPNGIATTTLCIQRIGTFI